MPRTTKNSAHVMNASVSQEENIVSQESSSFVQEMEVQSPPGFQPSTSQAQFVQPMFVPYIEGPKMDWTVNDSLCHRFLKKKLECDNILDFELARLAEKKVKKVIAWSGDFGIDQYVSWCLPTKIFAWILYGPSMKIFASHK